MNRSELLYDAWSRGLLQYKLKKNQLKIFNQVMDLLANPRDRKFVLHCSRRFGKSYILLIIAFVVCIRKPNSNIRYASTTAKAVRNIIKPIVKRILLDCPTEFRPDWNSFDGCYKFPNGSELHIAGVNNGHEDDLRGIDSHLNIVDEAGYIDQLTYVVDSVLMPQLINTNGICLISSSSPRTPAHEFATTYVADAKIKDRYVSYTLDDADYSEDIKEEFIREAGGRDSTTCRREYFNELIVDEDMQIVKEWKNDFIRDTDPTSDEFFQYYFKYSAMDMGVVDYTAMLYGYYDFKRAKLVILDEDQLDGNNVTTNTIRSSVIGKEQLHFGKFKPSKRIADNNDLRLLNDLSNTTGVDGRHDPKITPLIFSPVVKAASLQEMVNEMRIFVGNGQLEIHSRCKFVIGCLQFGVWNEDKTEWARTKIYKHFDHLAALMYLIRSIDMSTNPIPVTHGHDPKNYWIHPDQASANKKKKEIIKPWIGGSKR